MSAQYLEWFAAAFSLACVVLTVYKNPLCWPVGLIGIVAYGFVFFNTKLYADTILQVVFFAQGVYGWLYWVKGKQAAKPRSTKDIILDQTTELDTQVPVTRLNRKEWQVTLLSVALLTLASGSLLEEFTDAAAPFLDSFIMAASIVANMLMARKIWDNWTIWIVVNILATGLYYTKDLYISSGLYVIFLFLAIKGWIEWRKDLNGSAA
jgi:nicotinamide mononucleotide transporter